MGKIWKLAYANIRKSKSVFITLGFLFMAAALLVNIGMLVIFNYGSCFQDTKEELKSSDSYFYLPNSLYDSSVKDYINSNEHVKKTQENNAMLFSGKTKYIDKQKDFSVFLFNMKDKREMSKWKFVGEKAKEDSNQLCVYVPDLFKVVGGYQLNDSITFKCYNENTNKNEKVTFVIKGFIEDMFFSSTDTGCLGFYVPDETYQKIGDKYSDLVMDSKIVFANLDNVSSCSKVESGIREKLNIDSSSLMGGDTSKMIFSLDISLIELSRTMMATLISVMMILFAAVIVIVCLLVARFSIVNSLDDDILKIGSLKSIGYTDKQIKLSIIVQFTFLAMVGSIVGIGLSYGCVPAVAKIFERQSGLFWSQSFAPEVSIPVLMVILLLVSIIVWIVSGKVKKLTPVMALRGISNEKKLKRNSLPLEKKNGPLVVLLSLKSVVQNMKQNIMIIVILIAVTFAGAYGVIMYYNTSIDTSAFEEVPGMEICNAIVALNNEKEMQPSVDKIEKLSQVDYVQFVDEVKVKVDDIQAACTLMDSYKDKHTKLVYDGRYPKKDGEITIAGILAERINKVVGDQVTIEANGITKKYKIVGLSNGSSMGGINCSLLVKDYLTFNKEYKQQLLYIYLHEGEDAEKFKTTIADTLEKEDYLSYSNFDKGMEDGMASYQNIVAAMGIAMFAITIFIITLVLYFVISSTIVRKKRELGIKKAIGFSTFQLMNEYSLSFLVPIFIGTTLGSILGVVGCNPMMSVAMKGAGVMSANFIINPVWAILFGVFVLVFSYALSLLITWRIRKISAYALVTE